VTFTVVLSCIYKQTVVLKLGNVKNAAHLIQKAITVFKKDKIAYFWLQMVNIFKIMKQVFSLVYRYNIAN